MEASERKEPGVRSTPGSGQEPRAKRLIMLDFAGTLSLQTVIFGRKERLERALQSSGLDLLGFGEPSRFWEELVFPTWEEGALTTKGYAGVLTQRIQELTFQAPLSQRRTKPLKVRSLRITRIRKRVKPIQGIRELVGNKPGASQQCGFIGEVAHRFVQLYYRHSRIDPGWKPFFQDAQDTILIATDHYAECTPFLCRFLYHWGIRCRPIQRLLNGKEDAEESGEAGPETGRASLPVSTRCLSSAGARSPRAGTTLPVYIANSAYLGGWKKDPSFWEGVDRELRLRDFQHIFVIDDFGYNEHRGDPYAESIRVEKRRDSLLRCLTSLGATQVEVFPFYLESSVTDAPLVHLYKEYRKLVDKAILFFHGEC